MGHDYDVSLQICGTEKMCDKRYGLDEISNTMSLLGLYTDNIMN